MQIEYANHFYAQLQALGTWWNTGETTMLSMWRKQAYGVSVATLFSVAWFPTVAGAWQFRDLDSKADAPSGEATELIDLIPTEQQFVAPIVNAQHKSAAAATAADSGSAQPSKASESTKTRSEAGTVEQPSPAELKQQSKPEPAPKAAATPSIQDEAKAEPKKADTAEPAPGNKIVNGLLEVVTSGDLDVIEFDDVRIGSTTEKELRRLWGKPARVMKDEDAKQTYIYQTPSFRQLDVSLDGQRVSSILLHLETAASASEIAKELGIARFVSVTVADEYGEVLGHAYPERGILFSFAAGSTESVAAIILEPISSEMFRLRARQVSDHQYARAIADLERALKLDPSDAEALWLQSQYLDATGRTQDAITSIQKAIRLKPTNPMYRIARARLYAKTDRVTTAIEEIRAVISEIDMPNELAGHAHGVLGDLLAIGPHADHQVALESHLTAIDLAAKSAEDRRDVVRRLARRVLVAAHLSIARDIALGNFQRQSEVVPKWLIRATDMADEFIAKDGGDELLQLQIFRDALACYSEVRESSFEAAAAAEEALRIGRAMISAATDEHYKTSIERMLAETLVHAAKIHRTRGKHDTALQYANNALALLESASASWEDTSHDHYLLGDLYFTIGSIYAIRDQNHFEAVDWYAKARAEFVASDFVTPLYSNRAHGEMFVSMGLSLWETGQQEQGLAVTRSGAELMKDAVEKGSLKLQAMSVPYSNLAVMFEKMGRGEKSREYTELVAKVEDKSSAKR